MTLVLADAYARLETVGQTALLRYWNELTHEQQQQLLQQIEAIDWKTFHQQQKLLFQPSQIVAEEIAPLEKVQYAGNLADQEMGRELLKTGKMACLLVAGGLSTRLGIYGPKGLFPISPLMHKTLYQLFAEKTAAASRQAGKELILLVMTSPQTYEETVAYFHQHDNFGLNAQSLRLFVQKTLPYLDDSGNLFLELPWRIAAGPNGNGYSLKALLDTGLAEELASQGITALNFIQVDNPLADPFDAELLGFHQRQDNSVSLKCTARHDTAEKVGLHVCINGRTRIIEYSEFPEKEKNCLLPDGTLKFALANLSLFCFSLDFIIQVGRHFTEIMPLHLMKRQAKHWDKGTEEAYKFEYFIFDAVAATTACSALCYPRERCFAPLKNATGEHSPDAVRAAMQAIDRYTFSAVTGLPPPNTPFELSQEFYYPTEEVIQNWQNYIFIQDKEKIL